MGICAEYFAKAPKYAEKQHGSVFCEEVWAIWGEYFLKSPKRELFLGREAMEDFYTPNVHQRSLKIWQMLKKNSCAGTCPGQKCDTTSYMPNEAPASKFFRQPDSVTAQ